MQDHFVNKIKKWAKKNVSIARALEIATRAHQGQLDKAGYEYIKHPMAVAASLGMQNPKAVVVALLHDVFEDTEVTKEELEQYFTPEILDAVLALTKRANEDYITFIHRCAENPLARTVKIADLKHNMDLGRLKIVTDADLERVRVKYTPALNYLINFVDKDELSKLLFEECRDLPPGTLPHDAMNKAAFAHEEMFVSLLRNYVDESFIKDLDFTQITPLPNEFASEKLRKRYSDCIRKIRWRGRDAYILVILEFQSTKDIWIPVRILAYTALLWLDLIKDKIITREEGLPPVFPIVIYSGDEEWKNPLSIHELLSPLAKILIEYQPNNLAYLVNEKIIKDEVLNKQSDFYALYLGLKRARTAESVRNIILKYKDVLAKPEHYE
ncbi:MAG: Rpn family recombination-promoting nuclease/putative transposase, partial [Desulfovibrionaceae bacterium]|nr:Rpn family recombination-promoting nuclease/putative transposase [Desulfovibrionaceae bacterium]